MLTFSHPGFKSCPLRTCLQNHGISGWFTPPVRNLSIFISEAESNDTVLSQPAPLGPHPSNRNSTQRRHCASETSLCYRMASADTRKMTVTSRGERFPLKDPGILILHQDMRRIPKKETLCVLATDEQKGIRAALSLGDWSGHHVAGTVWRLTPTPGFIIHSPIPQSPLGMIIRHSCEKNVSVAHRNPGPGGVRSLEARFHRDPQHPLPCVHTHTHTHSHSHTHTLPFSPLNEMAKKVKVPHFQLCFMQFPPLNEVKLTPLPKLQSGRAQIKQAECGQLRRVCSLSLFSVPSGA